MLRRELKQSVIEEKNISFVDLRAIAIRWTDAVRQGGRSKPRAYSCDSYSQVADSVEASTNAVTVRSNDEISEIKECLRKQQAQLDAIMKHVAAQPPQPSRSNASFNSAKHFRFQPDGKPICHRCNRAGHIARSCRVNLTTSRTPVGSISEAGVHSQVMGGGLDSQPSEN